MAASAMLAPVLTLAAPSSHYDALIERARAGDYEPALEMLRTQGSAAGVRPVYDRIVIAGWAGKPDEAIVAYETLPAGPESELSAHRGHRHQRRVDRRHGRAAGPHGR